MKANILLLFLFLSFKMLGQNNHIQKMSMNNLEWKSALDNSDIKKIDLLISQNDSFPLLKAEDSGRWGVDVIDIKSDIYSQIYYYCLTLNREYSTTILNYDDYYRSYLINSYYNNNEYDKIFGNNIFKLTLGLKNLDGSVSEMKVNLDSLMIKLKNNLRVLEYIIQKRGNIQQYEALRLIYSGGGEESEWQVEKENLFLFYKWIYTTPRLFSKNVNMEELLPESVFLHFVSRDLTKNMDEEILLYLLKIVEVSKIEELFSKMYPTCESEEWNRDLAEAIPAYESEKILMTYYPSITKHCGYNLLHAAIVNVDINQVKELVRNDKTMLEKKTNPLHSYFISTYGEHPYTPLELALFKKEQWQQQYNSDKIHQGIFYHFRLQQIDKIIEFLRDDSWRNDLVWVLPYDTIL